MYIVKIINAVIMLLFFISYSYQFIYIVISLLYKPKNKESEKLSRIAVLIAARNEETVIGNLIDSITDQNYPAGFTDVYVAADNCTDNTAAIAENHGATVFVRHDFNHIGKGYALNYLIKKIKENSEQEYDAYLVLDADNILDRNFIREMNNVFTSGHEIVTCYRNSKNYGDNWISAGYALWFLREARYLNAARMAIGISCAVSGTGFLFSERVLQKCGGWQFFLLTEDIEFTIFNILNGEKVGYAANAVLYDEQPTTFTQSWRQRMRWSRGYLQVFCRHGAELIRGIFKGSFSCYDMTMNIMPAAVLTGISTVINLAAAVCGFFGGGTLSELSHSVGETLLSLYLTLFVIGAITTVTEWRSIYCSTVKKVIYIFTFPLFMLTYIPICIASLFSKVEWKPIHHKKAVTLGQIVKAENKNR